MKSETLKDLANNVVGYIETRDDGVQVLLNAERTVKGYYEPEGDHTRDANYNIVAKGDRLRSLMC